MPVNPLFSAAIPVNTFTTSDQVTSASALASAQARPMRAVAMAADGSFAITWSSKGQDGGGAEWGAYVRFFDKNGSPTSAEIKVNPNSSNNQSTTSIALLANGNYVVTWSDDSPALPDDSLIGVQARIYQNDGTAVGTELPINQETDGDQSNSAIATSANGKFVVTWVSNNDPGDPDDAVCARVFNSDGTPFSSEFRVNSTTASDQLKPSVAMADDGSFVVVWESQGQDGAKVGIYGQRYTSAGTATGSEFQISTYQFGSVQRDQKTASVAMAADGSFVVTWTSNEGATYGNEIYARRYDASGGAIGSEFRVLNPGAVTGIAGNQRDSIVTMAAGGGFIITWTSDDQSLSDKSGTGVYARRFNAAGFPIEAAVLVNSGGTLLDQDNASIAANASGDFIVAWTSQNSDPTIANEVFAQGFTVPLSAPPILTPTTASAVAYTENQNPVSLSTTIVVSDSDSPDLQSATITIGGYVSGQDSLGLLNGAVVDGITSAFDVGTGILTLSGLASTANYQTALRLVTYTNNSDQPNMGDRSITISVSDGANSGSVIRTIQITAVNDLPSVGVTSSPLVFEEHGTAVAIDSALTVTDLDNDNITSATVTINGFVAGKDTVIVTNQGTLSGGTLVGNVLTLTGIATKAEYQAALRSITFQSSSSPPTGDRTVDFVVNDGSDNSAVSSRVIQISAVDDPPVVTTTGTLTYLENTGSQVIDPTALTVEDVDSPNLKGATIKITNFNPGEDVLSFVDGFGITGIWSSGTGILELSGTTTIANYQDALRSITYKNSSLTPTAGDRTVQFTVNDATSTSAPANHIVKVTLVDDPPIVTPTSTNLSYNEDGIVAIDDSLTLTDPDSTILIGAIVTISGVVTAEDTFAFISPNSITGTVTSVDATTVSITLIGSASVADYQDALRAITYANSSTTPTETPRIVTFTVTDDTSKTSDVKQRIITVTDTLNAPIIATTGSSLTYGENDGAVAIDPGITVIDTDSPNLQSATISIGGYVAGQDLLSFTDSLGIIGSWNAVTGILTLANDAPIGDYAAALKTVTYTNSSENPTGLTRTIRFQANDGVSDGNSATRTLQIAGVNDRPEVTIANGSYIYTENAGAVFVDGLLTVKDKDNTTLARANVTINGYVAGEDTLSFVTASGITAGTFDAVAGTIAFTGIASVANYEMTLRSLKYTNSSSTPNTTTRTIQITVNDGLDDSLLASRSIQIISNTPPVVTPTTTTLNYSDNQGAVIIDGALSVTDADIGSSPNLSSAKVTIVGYIPGGEDVLTITNPQLGIMSSFDAVNGILTLSGVVAIASYQTALQSVTYTNTNPTPAATTRTLQFQVNDGVEDSNIGSRTIQIVVNAAPVITTTTTPLPYTESQGALAVTGGLTISDTDSANLSSATVTLIGYVAGEDTLAFGTLPSSITGGFNAATGIIAFVGSATLATYSALLATLTYTNSSSNPTTIARSLQIKVNDGIEDSATIARSIQITANAPPVLTLAGTTLIYTEGQGAIAIDNAILTITDDGGTLRGATVTIGGYVAAEDTLTFANLGSITGSFNAISGVLTLTGTATLANYQAALRTVTYTNRSANPTGATRSIEFQVNDGIEGSNPISRTIQVNMVASPPSGSGTGTPLNYNENAGAVPIDPGITLTDPDSPNLTGATITLTGFVPGQDVLTFPNQPPIIGTFNPVTGVLTLTGTATVAQYQAALQSVTYTNTSTNPATTPRQIEITVTDGTTTSNPAIIRPIIITPINTAPIVSATSGSLLYNENAGALAIDANIGVSDPDSATLTGATITLTNYVGGQDTLSFVTQNGIYGSFNAGVLTLGGSSSIANYQTALRSITYTNSSTNPDTTLRTLQISVTDGAAISNIATRSIQITAVNNVPVVISSAGVLAYAENAGAVAIDVGIAVSDADSATLNSATLVISGYVLGQDSLSLTTQNGISGAFDAPAGILRLTGSSTVANYQAALRSVTYTNNSNNPSTALRTLHIVVNDGTSTSAPVDRIIQVSVVNTPPAVINSPSSITYTENDGAIVIDGAIAVSDVDSTTFTGAAIAINGYVNGEDLLTFNNQGGISGSFNAGTGVLTLSGSAPIASYQVALRSITYSNLSSNPSLVNRTVQFTVNDGTSLSAPGSRTIQITQLNSPPVVATSSNPLSYAEQAGALAIDPGIFVLDNDSANLAGATVTLSGYVAGQDNLLFSNQNGISGSFNLGTGILTLTGAATVTSYQTALRSIAYLNSSNNPVTANRSVQFTVTDGTASSNLAIRGIQVTSVNTPPVLTLPLQVFTFSRATGAIAIAPTLIASDPDSPNLAGATITLGGYVAGQDSLIFADQNGIMGNFNAVTGTLSLSGTATVALYQAALRSLIYSNNSDTPATNPRTISISLTDGAASSNAATVQIRFDNSLSVPVLDLNGTSGGIDFSSTFVVSGAPVAIAASDAKLTGQKEAIASAQVKISNLLDGQAEELLVNTTGTGIIAAYRNGTLTLSGTASLDQYSQVLRTVQYQNHSDQPNRATRVILFSVSDGNTTSEPAQTTVQITQVNLDAMVTTPATDVIYASSSDNKVISVLENLQQNDTIDGGAGTDTFVLTNGTGTALVNVGNTSNQIGGILTGITTVRNFEYFDFSGFSGNVTMIGSDGINDGLTGGAGNDEIYGGAGSDRLIGNAGNDMLDGGSSNDILNGGVGDDIYIIDSIGDSIIEALDNGFDTVKSSLLQLTLGENLEDLVLIGNAVSGTGNNFSNNITGNGLSNTLVGDGGDDFISGSSGRDTLLGGTGDDRLDGGAGRDRLVGGSGDDTLTGGRGKDLLTGGKGKDVFFLESARRNSRDTITDFRSTDQITVSRRGFSAGLREGTIAANAFMLGSRAQDGSDRFIYDQRSGNLYFDADGTGTAAQIWVARLANRAAIGSSNIGVAF